MKTLHLIIRGRIPSKKNNRLNLRRGRKVIDIPSNRYREWENSVGLQLLKYKGLLLDNIEIQLEFWMPDNRETDSDNKVTSVFDMLKKSEIIKGDHWQVLNPYSVNARGIDKINPRVEIWIKSDSQ